MQRIFNFSHPKLCPAAQEVFVRRRVRRTNPRPQVPQWLVVRLTELESNGHAACSGGPRKLGAVAHWHPPSVALIAPGQQRGLDQKPVPAAQHEAMAYAERDLGSVHVHPDVLAVELGAC
jgi:hypothetical protein